MLDLNNLAAGGNPGITAEKGAGLAQAAAVCLEEQGHQQGTLLTIRGNVHNGDSPLSWPPATPQAHRTWNDNDEATEEGAAGIATLLANRDIGYLVILRSRKSTPQEPTGFDYWLGDGDIGNMSDAERLATESLAIMLADDNLVARSRMEVTGIRNGDDTTIRARTRRKLRQMNPSDAMGLPGYATVVEFGRPLAESSRK